MLQNNDLLVIASAFFPIDRDTQVYVSNDSVFRVLVFDQTDLGRQLRPGKMDHQELSARIEEIEVVLDTWFQRWIMGFSPEANALVVADAKRFIKDLNDGPHT